MDEGGYRTPLLARRGRVETRISLTSSHSVIDGGWFVGILRIPGVVMKFRSGSALKIMGGSSKSWRASLKNGVYMIRSATEHIISDINPSKA